MGLPLINPCSLPKAIKLPVNVRVPTKTLIAIVAALKVDGFAGLKYSAAATRADAPPPKPLKMATIWGIWVISTRIANVAPIMVPIIIPMTIILKSSNSKEATVATIAISIPTEAMAFPLRAVFGELSFFIPKIKRIAART